MRAEQEKLNSQLGSMSEEEKDLLIRRLLEENSEMKARLEVTNSAAADLAIQYQQIKEENAALKKEKKELLRQNRSLTDQLQKRKKDLFGRKSEQSSGIIDSVFDEDPEDPIDESSSEPADKGTDESEDQLRAAAAFKAAKHPDGTKKLRGHKTPGKRKRDLDSLPIRTVYDFDVDSLNRQYGEGNWRIAYWRKEDTIESVHTVQYHQTKYRPVVSVGLEHELVSEPCTKLMPGSLASTSLVAEMMYQKVVQCIPSYRTEQDFIRSGIPISRQTMVNWINRFSNELLVTAADYMAGQLVLRHYGQCDETPYLVIMDGRNAGSKSYMWVHTTSELDPYHPIIVFRFELTRKTDHLRAFYGDAGFTGTITSDCYCSYDVLEEEYADIHGSRCLMHARRKIYYATLVVDRKGVSPEVLHELPEFKSLILIDAINEAEQPLKYVSPEERLKGRQSTVREKVDAFFDYLRTLDPDNPAYSETFRDAIRYALKHEEKLRRFLDDPMIPIDNGFCERSIKPFATARRNWLFSFSVPGAEAAATLFTLVETAKANGAHPYYYLEYLLETLPKLKITKDKAPLEECMPWSDTYRAYEKAAKEKALHFFTDQLSPERPRTPRKKDKSA